MRPCRSLLLLLTLAAASPALPAAASVDGEQWFRTTDTATFPPGPMHLCVQLVWFPQGTGAVRESSMQVDRVARYALPG